MDSSIDVVAELHQQQFAKYMNVAALTAFVFDFCLTFPSEVYHVWGRKWDITRVVFTISRYLSIVASALTCYDALHSHKCSAYSYIIDGIVNVCFISAEGILIVRTNALWGHSRRVLAVLITLGVAFIIASTVTWSKVNISQPGDSDYTTECGSSVSRNAAFRCVFLMTHEIILQSMNTWRKLRTYRNVQSRVLNTLYWDGIMYMFWIILLMAVNTSVIIATPLPYITSLDTAQVALQSVFASRIFFNLRECDEHIRYGGSVTEMSLGPLQFSPQSVGISQLQVEDSVL
ncbi:hypothetical protein PAXRUDRAFT_832806 [Paxillus rubicundulus Ve08.2h10]|uniref:Unplaced genomic scaffold scaffold_967, whole genome shotgun sequence n=1 Tax=Paxillus rubicundulus Ve08.2h10 TaxID=930991 RepID=A0A0D0DIU1_9AGAM|nr:hypothetical protein PAXRUDRAFT_832806 [Paxillus rubicundulus Ve08.2h10]